MNQRIPLIVDLDELRRVFVNLTEHVQEVLENKRVELPNDYFWAIPEPSRYDVAIKPTELTIGQLSECWDNIISMDDSTTIAYGLVWLGEILKAIGETVVR